MFDSARNQLLYLAIEHLQGEYKEHPSACIALLIARYYRLLAENNEEGQQENHARANFWFECYLQQRGFAKKMRLHLKDQLRSWDFLRVL